MGRLGGGVFVMSSLDLLFTSFLEGREVRALVVIGTVPAWSLYSVFVLFFVHTSDGKNMEFVGWKRDGIWEAEGGFGRKGGSFSFFVCMNDWHE